MRHANAGRHRMSFQTKQCFSSPSGAEVPSLAGEGPGCMRSDSGIRVAHTSEAGHAGRLEHSSLRRCPDGAFGPAGSPKPQSIESRLRSVSQMPLTFS